MATVKLNPDLIHDLQQEIRIPFAILEYCDEADIEDDDYDEEIGSDPEKSYSLTFEFDGGHIALYDVKAKYFTVL